MLSELSGERDQEVVVHPDDDVVGAKQRLQQARMAPIDVDEPVKVPRLELGEIQAVVKDWPQHRIGKGEPRIRCSWAPPERPTTFSCGTGTRGSSFLVYDEILADHLRDVPAKRYGELVFFDAFDLAVAEHRMMHSVANRE